MPSKSGVERSTEMISPAVLTYSKPATDVARLPLPVPEPWVAVATASGDRDVRQRCEVAECHAVGRERLRHRPVCRRGRHRDGLRVGVKTNLRLIATEIDQLVRVNDVGERMSRPEHSDAGGRLGDRGDLVDRRRTMNSTRPVGVVPRPVLFPGGSRRVSHEEAHRSEQRQVVAGALGAKLRPVVSHAATAPATASRLITLP